MRDTSPIQFKRGNTPVVSKSKTPAAKKEAAAPPSKPKTRGSVPSLPDLMRMWVANFGDPDEEVKRLKAAGAYVPEPIVVRDVPRDPNQKLYRYRSQLPEGINKKTANLIRMWEESFLVDENGKVVMDGISLAMQERTVEVEKQRQEDVKRQWQLEAMKRNPRYKFIEK
jgi:hypothetical protein